MARKACAARSNPISLCSYYNVLREAIPRLYDEEGIFWGYCYFGVLRCWDVDSWSWETGFERFITGLLLAASTVEFVSGILKPASVNELTCLLIKRVISSSRGLGSLLTRSWIELLPFFPYHRISRFASHHDIPYKQTSSLTLIRLWGWTVSCSLDDLTWCV
jgi:hypothetical protein